MDLANNLQIVPAHEPDVGEGYRPADAGLAAGLLDQLLADECAPCEVLVHGLRESRREFESLLSCVAGAFYRCELAPPWRMEFISAGIEAITGYGPACFASMPYGEIVEPEDHAELARAVEEAMAGDRHFTATYRIRHRSGEVRWVNERGIAVRDGTGHPMFLEGYIVDVTEARSLEQQAARARLEIERLNTRMARILDNTIEGITTVDADWNYTFANRNALRDTFPDGDLVGRNALEVFPGFEATPAWPAMQRAMAARVPVHAECFLPDLGKWFELHAVPDEGGLTTFFRDISVRKGLEQSLIDQANDLRTTLDSIPHMVWAAHPDGSTDYYNKVWYDFVGRMPGAFTVDMDFLDSGLFHADDRDRVSGIWQEAIATGEPFEFKFRLRHHSGEFRWLLGSARPHRDVQGRIDHWYGTSTDIHDLVLAEQGLREGEALQASILESSNDCIKLLDLDGTLLQINGPGLRAMAIGSPEDVLGTKWPDFWPQTGKARARRAIASARNGKAARFTGFCPTAKGSPRWWDNVLTPILGADGRVTHVLCVSRDITGQRRSADRLRRTSEEDALTRLPNRRAFESRLSGTIAKAAETGASAGLMLLDLDHFKNVNDTLGHQAGDHLLRVLARRLKACVANMGYVARLGGDEFAIIIDGIREEKELFGAAAKVLATLEAPVTFSGKAIDSGLSIGCALFPRDAADARTLFRHADTALYDLKAGGRGGIQMFNSRMMDAAERSADQINLARSVVRNDAVEPYYQPKFRLDSGAVVGFEALLRWWSPGRGIQLPGSVAEAFNDYELAAKIGNLMQSGVLSDVSAWLRDGLPVLPVSINAAPAEFLRDDFAERLLTRLAETGVPPSLIEIEITEHAFHERRSDFVMRALQLLRQSGIRIALDDFGTGHSSLSHLRDFPVQAIKLDRSFIERMSSEPHILAIVKALASLGPSMALDVIAEGIETSAQLHALIDAGCAFGQGYLFGRAEAASGVERMLRQIQDHAPSPRTDFGVVETVGVNRVANG